MKNKQYVGVDDRSVLQLLHRFTHLVDGLLAHANTGRGLTAPQVAVLAVIAKHDEVGQQHVAPALGLASTTARDLVRSLVSKRLVKRRRAGNGQGEYYLSLTSKGCEALDIAGAIIRRANRRVMAVLPQARRASFLRALNKIIASANVSREAKPVRIVVPTKKQPARASLQ